MCALALSALHLLSMLLVLTSLRSTFVSPLKIVLRLDRRADMSTTTKKVGSKTKSRILESKRIILSTRWACTSLPRIRQWLLQQAAAAKLSSLAAQGGRGGATTRGAL